MEVNGGGIRSIKASLLAAAHPISLTFDSLCDGRLDLLWIIHAGEQRVALVNFGRFLYACCVLEAWNLKFGFSSYSPLTVMDPNGSSDEKSESRIYIGNLDLRITEAALIKMFSPFGKIITEDFLWHTRGRKRGEPRGFAFIQYSNKEQFLISTVKVSMQEARLAKEKMHGRLACGRPLVVRVSSDKYLVEPADNSSKGVGEATKTSVSGTSSGQTSRSSKIAAIKNKLKALEEEGYSAKKQKQEADTSIDRR
ncbi:hypothetical protein ACFX2F_001947 [Malus domestica]